MRIILTGLLCLFVVGCSQEETKTEVTESPVGSVEEVEEAEEALEQPMTGAQWLAVNAEKDGIVVLESGLQYEIIETGEGKTPGLTDKVLTHYEGQLTNGDIFDSSMKRMKPMEFPVNRVIAGWTEALQLMKEGDKWKLFIPAELGYGSREVGTIPADSVLVFELQLIEVNSS